MRSVRRSLRAGDTWLSSILQLPGVGFTEYSLDSGRSILALAVEACQKAMADAGLQPKDVDGILEFSLGDSVPTESVAPGPGAAGSQLRRRLVLRRFRPLRPDRHRQHGRGQRHEQGGSHLPGHERPLGLPPGRCGWRGCLPAQVGRPVPRAVRLADLRPEHGSLVPASHGEVRHQAGAPGGHRHLAEGEPPCSTSGPSSANR